MKKILTTLALALSTTLLLPQKVAAQITNPAVAGPLGNNAEAAASGKSFTIYFVQLWQAAIAVGGLAVLFFFVWGAVEWITAGGDSGKIEKARDKITQSVIGMVILVASFTIIGVINTIFFGDSINLLAPEF